MTTLLGERIAEAVNKKNTDISSFGWKGVKVLDQDGKYKQEERKLIDMKFTELRNCYDHCKTMLFNKDLQNPGRYFVLEMIADQKDRCGAELFLRYVKENHDLAKYTLLGIITGFLETNKVVFKDVKPTLKDMFSNMPNEYEKLPLSLLIDGCLDRLGAFNKKHITRTFILKQGVWLTPAESKELLQSTESDPSKDRLEIVRECLGLKDIEKLYINSKGINYTQMRSMLSLKTNKKYTDLTTMQLLTLRNRILFNLEETVKSHINSWEKRMEEIEMVANHNQITLE